MKIEFLTLAFMAVVAICLLWRFLPVGQLHGRTIRLHEWPRWRVNLRWEKIDRLMAEIRTLPPAERLRPLAGLALKYGREPLGKGDSIMEEIASLGTEASLPLMRDLLRDTAPLSAKPLMRGIQTACRQKTVTMQWRATMFEDLVAHLDDGEWTGRAGFYGTLLALDGAKAMERMCHPEAMSTRNPDSSDLIHAVNLSGHILPGGLASKLIKENDELPESARNSQRTLELLEAWAHHDPDDARRRLWELIREGGRVAEDAAICLLGVEKLPHPRFAVDARVERLGLDGVSQAERTVWLVDNCYLYPLSCHSILAFFEEDYADRFDEIVSALRAIGAGRHAELLMGAGSLFGPSGPEKTAAGRTLQMDQMQPSAGDLFEAYAAAQSGKLEDARLLNLVYVLDNAAEFPRGLSVFGEPGEKPEIKG